MSQRSRVQYETRGYRTPSRAIEAMVDALKELVEDAEVTLNFLPTGAERELFQIEVRAPREVIGGIEFWLDDRAESRVIRNKRRLARLLRGGGPVWWGRRYEH